MDPLTSQPSSQAEKTKKRRVLVIEDDPHTQLLLTKNLEFSGYEVLTACDGQEGVRVALERIPDLILLDLLLPRLDGWEVCRRLREPNSSVRTVPIMIVSIIGKDSMQPTQVMGPISFFNKPFQVQSLLGEIQRILGRAIGG